MRPKVRIPAAAVYAGGVTAILTLLICCAVKMSSYAITDRNLTEELTDATRLLQDIEGHLAQADEAYGYCHNAKRFLPQISLMPVMQNGVLQTLVRMDPAQARLLEARREILSRRIKLIRQWHRECFHVCENHKNLQGRYDDAQKLHKRLLSGYAEHKDAAKFNDMLTENFFLSRPVAGYSWFDEGLNDHTVAFAARSRAYVTAPCGGVITAVRWQQQGNGYHIVVRSGTFKVHLFGCGSVFVRKDQRVPRGFPLGRLLPAGNRNVSLFFMQLYENDSPVHPAGYFADAQL